MKIGNTSNRLFTVGGLVTKVELKLTSGSLNQQIYQSILFCEESGIVGMSVRPMAFVIICIKGILAPYPKYKVGTSLPHPF